MNVQFLIKMDFGVGSELSCKIDDLLNNLNLKFGSEKLTERSKTWLELLNYNFESSTDPVEMEVEENAKEDIVTIIKESLEKNSPVPETIFVGVSVNEVNRVLCSIRDFLDEMKFSAFCNLIGSWKSGPLVEFSIGTVVLPKLRENSESSTFVTHSVKQLALNKPENVSENLIIPLFLDDLFQFTDSELLTEVFSSLPDAQKDFIILTISKKLEFSDNDWQLLGPLIRYLSQNSLLLLMECVLKHSKKFRKSQIFGRFLVSFCKHVEFIGNKETLRETIEEHETLLKMQALKYLDLI